MHADSEPTVRVIETDDEIRAFLWGLRTAFLSGKDVTDEMVDWVRERWDFSRTWAAFDGDVQCGTAGTFPSELRLPGGNEVLVSCLTRVTVLPTHTRRGHVTRLMRTQLDAAVEAGEVASLLVAAEWPIYGRFGYGPATEWVQWEVDTPVAEVLGAPSGSCELVDAQGLLEPARRVLERQQEATPGSIRRPEQFLAMTVGTDPRPGDEKHEDRVRVVHRDADGEPDAFAIYDPKEHWVGMRPDSTLDVQELAAATTEGGRELWRYLIEVDLVGQVKAGGSVADPIRYALVDGRAARQVGRWDHIWARILDVAPALAARSYTHADRLVFEVVDGFLDRGGRYALETGADGAATCAPTSDAADLTLPIAALSAAWLGDTDLRQLAASGAIDEDTPGALARAAALLRWHQTAYCATDF